VFIIEETTIDLVDRSSAFSFEDVSGLETIPKHGGFFDPDPPSYEVGIEARSGRDSFGITPAPYRI
jgi:hypothetical protein